MDAAPQPSPVPAPAPTQPDMVRAWPASAQWVTAFLFGVATTLLLVNAFSYLRIGFRPTEWQPDDRIAPVDLNTATQAELVQLPGIGPTLAQRITQDRDRNGAFQSVNELRRVSGIGPNVLERLRPWVRVTIVSEAEAVPVPSGEHGSPRAVTVSLPQKSMAAETRRAPSKKEDNLQERIDLNRASQEELQRIPGIGPTLSRRIVDERTKRPFRSVDELRRVPGIGPKTLEKVRPFVTVGNEPGRVARAG